MATGMESMANNLIKSISGMTIDEIKMQAIEAQKKVLEFINMVNSNFQALATMIRTSSDNDLKAHTLSVNAAIEVGKRVDTLMHSTGEFSKQICNFLQQEVEVNNNLIAQYGESICTKLDSMRLDTAQLLMKQGVELSDDLINLLAERATGMKSNGKTKLFSVPPLTQVDTRGIPVDRVERPENGVEPANSTQPTPSQYVEEISAEDRAVLEAFDGRNKPTN